MDNVRQRKQEISAPHWITAQKEGVFTANYREPRSSPQKKSDSVKVKTVTDQSTEISVINTAYFD